MPTEKRKIVLKILGIMGLLVSLALLAWMLLSGGNLELLRSIFLEEHTNEELRDKLASLGIRGYITVVILSMLQVLIPVLPAEPVQVLAGLTFGFPVGLLCCTIGVAIGNTLIYITYKIYGDRLRAYFMKKVHLDFDRAARSVQLTAVIFILYFLPAIPYGMICFFAASVGMKYLRFITVTILGAIPSVCIGVGLGHIAIASSWILSVVICAVLLILIGVMMAKKEAIFAKVNAYLDRPPYSSKTTVKDYSPVILPIAYVISRIVLFLKGVRVRYINKLGHDVESPSIVLVNHGSFIDFAYAGSLIYKTRPHFIVARLYFCHKWVGWLLRKIGAFPKSMFAQDLESAKNCLRVLRGGGVLAMMPEARLSTVGSFEDIQPGTYDFLKKAAVPVYSIKISGDYLCDPKWGHGVRRGSLVEAELDLLLSKEELAALSPCEIGERVEARLRYDELAWLQTRPELHYKSKRIAEGLENILTTCPKCKQKYTITTKGKDVFCEKCGKVATMDDRYAFDTNAPFANFADWYAWQKEELSREISSDPNYALTSPVEFLLPSADGKSLLRHAGRGVCTLDRTGLTYRGEQEGEEVTLFFPMSDIYRLLFGAGENFEIYVGRQIHYFRPDERRSAVEWYITSEILKKESMAIPENTTLSS